MKEYNIAIYIRLSIADEDTGTSKAESDSIGNQRNLINRFLDRHPALSKYPRSEFCDDGFTGTNTDRPAFTDMMNRVKKGEFNLICVKDFSRFSRDYIEIGDCLECLFPFLGVRFISINDNYDSDNYIGTTGGLDVVMRNIVYAAYSKDLSVKTTTAKIQLMKQGKFVGGYAPYGYVLHPTIRNKLAIDPEAASVVRKIFLLAIDGSTPLEIAIWLNNEGIPTPGQYFIERHPDTKKYRRSSDKLNWSHAMVYRTLTKLVYTGCAVGHERRIVAPLSRKTAKQDVEKQFIVENMHEAIVSREEYDKAQAVIRKTGRSPSKASYYPLRSLVRCGNCGRCMTFLKSRKGFYCTYGRTDKNSACPTEAIYMAADIEQRIYDAIMLFLKAAGEKGNLSDKLLKKKKSEIENYVGENEVPATDSVDKFTLNCCLVLFIYGLVYLIMRLVNIDLVWGFNFLLGSIFALVVRQLLNLISRKKIMQKEITNNFLLDRISGLAFDMMIISGVAAIDLNKLTSMWWQIVLICTVGAVVTFIYIRLVANHIFKGYEDEGFFAFFGMLTGTASNGMILLREVDPKYETPAASNLVLSGVPAIAFGGGLLIVLGFCPNGWLESLITFGILLVAVTVFTLILFRQKLFKKKK